MITTLPLNADLTEPLGNQCPECDCHGSIVIYHSMLRDWETGEYTDTEEDVCPACDGLGYLTEPATPAPWWDGLPLDDVPAEDAFTQALRYTVSRRATA